MSNPTHRLHASHGPADSNVRSAIFVALLLVVALTASLVAKDVPLKSFRSIPTQYYTFSTDAADDVAREAVLRMDRMFEEYSRRISNFARPPQGRIPFRLYSSSADYQADGGPAGSLGVVKWGRGSTGGLTAQLLVTLVDERQEEGTWHVMQHEGFHLFAMFSIPRGLPVWVAEGLADYYAISRFVGDGFVYGRIPENRRHPLFEMIKAHQHLPFSKLTALTSGQWNASLSAHNYLQAWSWVHFLIEGEQGKRQKPFNDYLAALARGANGPQAWNQFFGRETNALEEAWKKYWTGLPPNATATLERQIKLMTIASFLTHAAKAGKKYEQLQILFTDARRNAVRLPLDPALWLPPKMLDRAIESVQPTNVTLTWNGAVPKLVETQKDGSTITVTYADGRVVATTQPVK